MSADNIDPVQLDDELIDALVYHQCGRESCCVSAALRSWQREINARPIGQLDTDEALAAVAAGRHRRAGWWSQLRAALVRDRWPWRKRLPSLTTMWTTRSAGETPINATTLNEMEARIKDDGARISRDREGGAP